MEQPLNGRILVRVDKTGEYKHVGVALSSDKKHEFASIRGEVLAVAADTESLVRENYGIKDGEWPKELIHPSDLVGKIVRWDKYADQNTLHDIDDPKKKGEKIKVSLILYKDITSYEI